MSRSIFQLLVICLLAVGVLSCDQADQAVDAALRVGMDPTYPPFESLDPDGNPTGVSVDLAIAIAKDLDRPLEIVPLPFDGLITALKTNKIDLILSSMTANEKRRQSIDFSEPYVRTGLALLTSKSSTIEGLDDLKKPGSKVAVRLGTTGEAFAAAQLPDARVTTLEDNAACVMEVVNDRVDAYIYDQLSIFRYHQQHPDTTHALLKPIQEEFWAIGIAKGNDELRSEVNTALSKIRKSGHFDELADRYLAKEKASLEAMGVPFIFVREEDAGATE